LTRLLNLCSADKLFFHFFQSFFERLLRHICRVEFPFNEGDKGWQAFFSLFFESFLSAFRALSDRGLPGYHLRPGLTRLDLCRYTENEAIEIPTFAGVGSRFDYRRCRRLAFRLFPRQTNTSRA
jgi:hypothetical protein